MEQKFTVLIIDDEVDLTDALKFQLEARKGYTVYTAHNGVEGLEKLKAITPHLIVLDMNMPKMGGIEFYKNVCDSAGKVRYPILVLTARAHLEQLFKEFNVDGFMTKPFDLEKLLQEVEFILQKHYAPPSKEEIKAKEGPRTVLIIENNEDVFNKLAVLFLNAGFLVVAARTAMNALDRILDKPPDAIVVKLGLPDLPGDLVIAKLRYMPKTKDAAFVLYTNANDRLNHVVTDKIIKHLGLSSLIESEDPAVLLKEVEHALQK